MIATASPMTKTDWSRFAAAPVDESSEQWQSLDEKLPADHIARQIDQQVAALDFTPLIESYKFSGSPPLRPDLMLKIVLFQYHRGATSPAKWVVAVQENYALQWLGQGIQPSRSVWYQFVTRIGPWVDQWNQQVLAEVNERGLISDLGGSLDGSSFAAAATRHRLLTLSQVDKRILFLEQAMEKDPSDASLIDMLYWIGNTPRGRLIQHRRYLKARRVLKKQHAVNELQIPSKRKPAGKIRVSVADPEAPLGLDKHKVYRPLYNVQLLRDVGSPFILAYETFARTSDSGTLVPMLARVMLLARIQISKLLADSGYVTGLDLADASQHSLDLYGPWKSNDYSGVNKVKKDNTSDNRFTKDDFQWNAASSSYHCPQGARLTRRGTQTKKRSLGRTESVDLYRADKQTCQGCPLKPKCCPKSKSGRNLNRSEHEALIDAHKKNGIARVEAALQVACPDGRIIIRRCQGASQLSPLQRSRFGDRQSTNRVDRVDQQHDPTRKGKTKSSTEMPRILVI